MKNLFMLRLFGKRLQYRKCVCKNQTRIFLITYNPVIFLAKILVKVLWRYFDSYKENIWTKVFENFHLSQ